MLENKADIAKTNELKHAADKMSGNHSKTVQQYANMVKDTANNSHVNQHTKTTYMLKSVNSEMDARRIQKNIKADERTRNINKNIAEYRAKRGETEKFPKRTIDCY